MYMHMYIGGRIKTRAYYHSTYDIIVMFGLFPKLWLLFFFHETGPETRKGKKMNMSLEPSEGTQFCQHLDILICKNVRNSYRCWKCNNEQNRRLNIRWICAFLALCLYNSSSINARENMTKMMSGPFWFNPFWEN